MTVDQICTNKGCGKRLRVKDDLAGKRIKCPACGTVQLFAAPASPVPPEKVAPEPPRPETSPVTCPSQPEAPKTSEGVRRFARLVERLNEKGTANFGQLFNRLGAAPDLTGVQNLAWIIASMTETQIASFARLLNTATPGAMELLAKLVSSQPHLFLQQTQTTGQGTSGAAGAVSGCITLLVFIFIVLKILHCMGVIH